MIRQGWKWVPTVYLYQGIPYSIVMTTSSLFYKDMGISLSSFAFWTSLLYLPWTIKPLWSPLIENISTKRNWIIWTQVIIALAFILLGATFCISAFYITSLLILTLVAFSSASHDIAADGYYLMALSPVDQSFFVGIRSTFYRIAMLSALGIIPQIVGFVQEGTDNIPLSWTISFVILAVFLLLLAIYNAFFLPKTAEKKKSTEENFLSIFGEVLRSFFTKKGALISILFLFLYRLGESQLAKVATPFLVDDRCSGGLGMNLSQYGLAYGTFGMIALTAGGIFGGWLASRYGLKRVIWWMVALMNLPNLIYVFLSIFRPESTSWSIYLAIIFEQGGYGFGFTAYMLFLMDYVRESRYKTAEYALGTTIMALGMMLPGMFSGFVCEAIGYEWFFVYVVICCVPGTILTKLLPLSDC